MSRQLLADVYAAHPHIARSTIRNRLCRGIPLSAPCISHSDRVRRHYADPLNAACNAWRLPASMGRPGVRVNLRCGL